MLEFIIINIWILLLVMALVQFRIKKVRLLANVINKRENKTYDVCLFMHTVLLSYAYVTVNVIYLVIINNN